MTIATRPSSSPPSSVASRWRLTEEMLVEEGEDDALIRDDPDRLVAFWDGESRRTLTIILHARAAGIPVTLIDKVGKETPYVRALIAAEENGVLGEWLEARRRAGRPIKLAEKAEDLLKTLWEPFIGYREVGSGKEWHGGPV